MLVQEILKSGNKQVGLLINNKCISFSEAVALYNRNVLENVVLVDNKYFRSRKGYKIKITEVVSYVKRNEGSLGQVQSGKGLRGNKRGASRTSQSSEEQKIGNRYGEGVSKNSRRGGGRQRESDFSSSSSIQLRLKKLDCKVFKEVDSLSFKNDFDKAKLSNKNAKCVDSHELSELESMKCLRSENGFVAVEDGGNINSVLRDVNKPLCNHFLRDLLLNALANGACKLDCFAIMADNRGGLAELYSRYGFIPVCRDHFNRDFAPDGWNYERDGEPDVVFMYHCGDSIEKVVEKSGKGLYKHYLDYDVPYITEVPQYIEPPEDYDWDKDERDLSTYSQALRYRDWKMERVYRFLRD